jgi:hypothetical protein
MATAGRFAASSEEEIAKILSEKDAENTKRSIYESQAISLFVHCQFQGLVIYGDHSLLPYNYGLVRMSTD